MTALLDKNYTYIISNKAYLDAFGFKKDQLIGKTLSKVFGKKFFEGVIKPHANECLRLKKVVRYSDWFNIYKTRKKYMEFSYSPYFDENKKIKGFIINGRNKSIEKKAEDELIFANKLKKKRLAKLVIANKKLIVQNK